MHNSPLFCFECGSPLKMGYPGNNPENGSARMQCPKGHDTLWDYALQHHGGEIAIEVLRGLTEEIPGETVPSVDIVDPVDCVIAQVELDWDLPVRGSRPCLARHLAWGALSAKERENAVGVWAALGLKVKSPRQYLIGCPSAKANRAGCGALAGQPCLPPRRDT